MPTPHPPGHHRPQTRMCVAAALLGAVSFALGRWGITAVAVAANVSAVASVPVLLIWGLIWTRRHSDDREFEAITLRNELNRTLGGGA